MSPSDPPDAAPSVPYVVVARRYRPQSFSELVGQQHVGQALAGAIETNRVGHAYLFTGARGVGKTSAARILAKALNCRAATAPTVTPCNQCDVCRSVAAGEDVDVIEIDGASNRGIDEIRELRQTVNVRPSRCRYKIYIIDEVHMLTREAFNALLKTLEEPPEHVKFIFCTTEAEKIPITILSRCQRFDFAGIQTTSIAERLQQIVVAEGVEADAEALQVLARRAAGSMRDSQSLLEQLLACGHARITVDDIHRLLGTAGDGRLSALAEHVCQRNAAAALADLDSAIGAGVDVGQFLDQLLAYFRDLLVVAVGASDEILLCESPAELPRLRSTADRLGVATILAAMQIIDQTLARLRVSTHGRILAELAIVRLCQLDELDELSVLIAQVREGNLSAASDRAGGVPQAPISAAKKKAEPVPSVPPGIAGSPPASQVLAPEKSTPAGSLAEALTAENVQSVWQRVLKGLSDLTSANALMAERVAISAPNVLVLSFPSKYTSCMSFCERPEQASRLQQAFFEATGQSVRLRFELLGNGPEAAATPANSKAEVNPREKLLERVQHPLVQQAMELFGAQPVRLIEPQAAQQ